jgi:hypothetical protein
MVYSYENDKAAPSDEAVLVASQLIGITTEDFAKKKIKASDYAKDEIKKKAKELLNSKNLQHHLSKEDYKDKYIEALETIVKKQEALLIETKASLAKVSSRLVEVEKGLDGARENQRVMYALQMAFQDTTLPILGALGHRKDIEREVGKKVVAYLEKSEKEGISA